MPLNRSKLMKWPLIVAAVFVVLRVVLERLAAPEALNNVFGVAWLYLVVPFVFAAEIARSGEPKPFKALLKNLVIFAAITRLMVMPTYWLAYMFNWTQPRFLLDQGGVVGSDVTPLMGYILIPLRNAVFWTVAASLIGMLLGGMLLGVRRRSVKPA